jgi:hypothetical protein
MRPSEEINGGNGMVIKRILAEGGGWLRHGKWQEEGSLCLVGVRMG